MASEVPRSRALWSFGAFGFGALGFRDLGFRDLGFRDLGSRVYRAFFGFGTYGIKAVVGLGFGVYLGFR